MQAIQPRAPTPNPSISNSDAGTAAQSGTRANPERLRGESKVVALISIWLFSDYYRHSPELQAFQA